MRISIHLPDPESLGLTPLIGASLGAHIVLLLTFAYLPVFLSSRVPAPVVYTVDLVDLPPLPEPPSPGPPAGTAGEREEDRPEPPPERKPPDQEKEPTPVPRKKRPREPEEEKKPPVVTRKKPSPAPPPLESPPDSAPRSGEDSVPPTAAGPGNEGVASIGPGLEGKPVRAGFDDASFRYNYYAARMISILRSQWSKPIRPPGARGSLRAVVFFVIARDGTIVRSELEESSGYQALDLSALRAVRETRRLPPLPMQYENDSVGVRLVFELKPEDSP